MKIFRKSKDLEDWMCLICILFGTVVFIYAMINICMGNYG